MIDDRHVEGFEPARHRLADPAEADDPDLALAQRGRQRIGALQPLAGAQIAVDLRQLAHGRQQQADGEVGDLVGQHIRRIGDDDAALAGSLGIDIVVADAEIRDDFKLRQRIEQCVVDPHMRPAPGDTAHPVFHRSQRRRAILLLPELVHGEARLQLVGGIGHQWPGHDDLDLVLRGHGPAFWNAAWLDFKFLKRLDQPNCSYAAGEFPQPQTGAASEPVILSRLGCRFRRI